MKSSQLQQRNQGMGAKEASYSEAWLLKENIRQ
jgi:hypothetical protein